jgi:hypothetical protein
MGEYDLSPSGVEFKLDAGEALSMMGVRMFWINSGDRKLV